MIASINGNRVFITHYLNLTSHKKRFFLLLNVCQTADSITKARGLTHLVGLNILHQNLIE